MFIGAMGFVFSVLLIWFLHFLFGWLFLEAEIRSFFLDDEVVLLYVVIDKRHLLEPLDQGTIFNEAFWVIIEADILLHEPFYLFIYFMLFDLLYFEIITNLFNFLRVKKEHVDHLILAFRQLLFQFFYVSLIFLLITLQVGQFLV